MLKKTISIQRTKRSGWGYAPLVVPSRDTKLSKRTEFYLWRSLSEGFVGGGCCDGLGVTAQETAGAVKKITVGPADHWRTSLPRGQLSRSFFAAGAALYECLSSSDSKRRVSGPVVAVADAFGSWIWPESHHSPTIGAFS